MYVLKLGRAGYGESYLFTGQRNKLCNLCLWKQRELGLLSEGEVKQTCYSVRRVVYLTNGFS